MSAISGEIVEYRLDLSFSSFISALLDSDGVGVGLANKG
jgi:hypothetical protein